MQWLDIYDIAEALDEKHPDFDIYRVRFTDLARMIQDLESFSGDPKGCNEKVLEAIQSAWWKERN